MSKEKNSNQNIYSRSFWRIGILFIIALFVEVFVCNYRFWITRDYEQVKPSRAYYGSGLEKQADGSYIIISDEDKYIELLVDEEKVNNIYLGVKILNRENAENDNIPVYIQFIDDSHAEYYPVPDKVICQSQKSSQYLTTHFYGNCQKIRFTIAQNVDTCYEIKYALNVSVPMFFSVTRMLVIFILLLVAFLFRPSSSIYKIKYLENKEFTRAILIGFVILHTLVFLFNIKVNPVFQIEDRDNTREYHSLAEALAEGSFSILKEASDALVNMENPYDFGERTRVMYQTQESYLWDHAFFEGKYYVYFGVVPCILFYLPYYVLTGSHMHNNAVIFISSVVMLISCLGIISQIIKRWFQNTSIGAWLLLTELFVLGSNVLTMTKRPDMYTVPIAVGWAFGLLGLWLFLLADENNTLNWKWIALGSLCFALIAGCRPQLFLIIVPAVIILKRYIFSISFLLSKQGLKAIVAFVIPMLVVAGFLMYYNYARFHNPFDFGANYNLSMNDMRNRGFVPERIPSGLLIYLFAPIKLEAVFPFLYPIYTNIQYLGETITETTFGGALATNLFFWIPFFPILYWKENRKKLITPLIISFLVCALCIVVVDTEMSGLLLRYFNDFSIFFCFASILAWLVLYEKAKGKYEKRAWRLLLLICFFLSLVHQFFMFFLDTGEALRDVRLDIFQYVKYQVMFWL